MWVADADTELVVKRPCTVSYHRRSRSHRLSDAKPPPDYFSFFGPLESDFLPCESSLASMLTSRMIRLSRSPDAATARGFVSRGPDRPHSVNRRVVVRADYARVLYARAGAATRRGQRRRFGEPRPEQDIDLIPGAPSHCHSGTRMDDSE